MDARVVDVPNFMEAFQIPVVHSSFTVDLRWARWAVFHAID
jgi:hypothetical protein